MSDEPKCHQQRPLHAKIERDALIEADDWLQAAQDETRGDAYCGHIREAIRQRINELDETQPKERDE